MKRKAHIQFLILAAFLLSLSFRSTSARIDSAATQPAPCIWELKGRLGVEDDIFVRNPGLKTIRSLSHIRFRLLFRPTPPDKIDFTGADSVFETDERGRFSIRLSPPLKSEQTGRPQSCGEARRVFIYLHFSNQALYLPGLPAEWSVLLGPSAPVSGLYRLRQNLVVPSGGEISLFHTTPEFLRARRAQLFFLHQRLRQAFREQNIPWRRVHIVYPAVPNRFGGGNAWYNLINQRVELPRQTFWIGSSYSVLDPRYARTRVFYPFTNRVYPGSSSELSDDFEPPMLFDYGGNVLLHETMHFWFSAFVYEPNVNALRSSGFVIDTHEFLENPTVALYESAAEIIASEVLPGLMEYAPRPGVKFRVRRRPGGNRFLLTRAGTFRAFRDAKNFADKPYFGARADARLRRELRRNSTFWRRSLLSSELYNSLFLKLLLLPDWYAYDYGVSLDNAEMFIKKLPGPPENLAPGCKDVPRRLFGPYELLRALAAWKKVRGGFIQGREQSIRGLANFLAEYSESYRPYKNLSLALLNPHFAGRLNGREACKIALK